MDLSLFSTCAVNEDDSLNFKGLTSTHWIHLIAPMDIENFNVEQELDRYSYQLTLIKDNHRQWP